MVKGGTGFRKQASKRRIITYQKNGSNDHVSSEVDEIADNSIVNIDIVVGDEAIQGTSSSSLQTSQEVSFSMSLML